MRAADGGGEAGQGADVIQTAGFRQDSARCYSALQTGFERSVDAGYRKSGDIIRPPRLTLIIAKHLHRSARRYQVVASEAGAIAENHIAVGDSHGLQKILFDPQTGVRDPESFFLVAHGAQ